MELSPTLFSALACAMLWILIDNRQDMENMHMFCAHVALMKHIPWQHVMLQVRVAGPRPPQPRQTQTPWTHRYDPPEIKHDGPWHV